MADAPLATLIAASIAAIVSIAVAILTILNGRRIDQVVAGRSLLAKDLSDLGNELYAIVALSKKMVDAKTDQSFSDARTQADDSARKLDELRRKNRYALWGIDDGFRTIQWCPVYIAHNKASRNGDRAKSIIERSTALRKSIDKAIMKTYFCGKKPSLLRRSIIKIRAKNLREYFEDGHPGGNG